MPATNHSGEGIQAEGQLNEKYQRPNGVGGRARLPCRDVGGWRQPRVGTNSPHRRKECPYKSGVTAEMED